MYNEFACVFFFKFVINHRSCVGSDSLVNITLPEVISLFNDENKFSMLFFFFTEKTPGPAAYSPRLDNSKLMSPAFTIRSLRREKSHVLGPFATF